MAVQPLALFVVGSTSLTTSDAAVKSRLEGLGYSVTVKSANNSATTDANSTNLIVISSTVNPSQVNTKFRDVTVPVIVYESALFDDMKMTGTKSTDFGSTTGQSVIQIVDASHSIASGLSGSVAVVSTGDTFSWGVPSPYAQKIATLSSNSARATIFAYENGATMVGQVAPARRVGVFLSDTVPQNLTADGWKLFDGAVDWSVKRVHRQCLFVTGSLTLSASDSEIKKQLEGRGFTVTVSTGAAVTASDAARKNLVVVSASVTGADVNTKMRDVAAPVVVAEPDLFDDMKMTGATGGADFGSAASQTTVSIVDSAHALAGGLTGTVTISMSGTTIGWGKPSSSAAKVAAIASDNSKIALFGYAEGASMVGLTAPGRRVGLFFGETLGSVAT
ncbi:MAG TPA: hypothetical protein VLM38_13585 [Blastocatellia bacterium]|nr:hypothetical protein [Blastocatellia bacterium]